MTTPVGEIKPDDLAYCSLCGHPFSRSQTRTFPFCSTRCQQIDLGQWLDEKHGLPIEGQEEQEFDDSVSDPDQAMSEWDHADLSSDS